MNRISLLAGLILIVIILTIALLMVFNLAIPSEFMVLFTALATWFVGLVTKSSTGENIE